MSRINEIIRKYFFDTQTSKASTPFIEWLKNGKSVEEKEEAFREIWDELDIAPDQTTEHSFMKLQQRILSDSEPIHSKKSIPLYRKFLRIASILIIPIISVVGSYMYVKNNSISNDSIEFVECFVPNGQIKEVILPDSTTVQLNSGSVLIYPKSFSGKTRDLYLNGEALFSVTHNEEQPFIVKTADMDIEVLGTVFNVSSYHTSERIATTLQSGKVSVTMKNQESEPIILSPSQQILVDRRTGETNVKEVNVENTVAWQKGYLMMESLNIRDISKILERKYDATIHINTEKYDQQYVTAKFRNNESLIESLSVLQELIPGMKYTIEANKVYIY